MSDSRVNSNLYLQDTQGQQGSSDPWEGDIVGLFWCWDTRDGPTADHQEGGNFIPGDSESVGIDWESCLQGPSGDTERQNEKSYNWDKDMTITFIQKSQTFEFISKVTNYYNTYKKQGKQYF